MLKTCDLWNPRLFETYKHFKHVKVMKICDNKDVVIQQTPSSHTHQVQKGIGYINIVCSPHQLFYSEIVKYVIKNIEIKEQFSPVERYYITMSSCQHTQSDKIVFSFTNLYPGFTTKLFNRPWSSEGGVATPVIFPIIFWQPKVVIWLYVICTYPLRIFSQK